MSTSLSNNYLIDPQFLKKKRKVGNGKSNIAHDIENIAHVEKYYCT